MKSVIRQYIFNLFINGFLMSYFVSPRLRKIILNLLKGNVKGVIHGHCTILTTKIYLGKNSYINRNCLLDNAAAKISIGENCAIACDVHLLTTTHDYSSRHRRAGKVAGKEIKISDGCWICSGVTVLPETTIGEGTIVAAGSVVTGNIDANSSYAGIPA